MRPLNPPPARRSMQHLAFSRNTCCDVFRRLPAKISAWVNKELRSSGSELEMWALRSSAVASFAAQNL